MAPDCGDFAEYSDVAAIGEPPGTAGPRFICGRNQEPSSNPGWTRHDKSCIRLTAARPRIGPQCSPPLCLHRRSRSPLGHLALRRRRRRSRCRPSSAPRCEPYGRWERHARWGEVWIPANRSRDWRPYTVGRWVYTEDWGWYWVEDQRRGRLGLGDLPLRSLDLRSRIGLGLDRGRRVGPRLRAMAAWQGTCRLGAIAAGRHRRRISRTARRLDLRAARAISSPLRASRG